MAFLPTTTLCFPAMEAAVPRRSLLVARATAKSSEQRVEPANSDAAYSSGRRQAIMLFAATATVTAASSALSGSTSAGPGSCVETIIDASAKEIANWAVNKYDELTGEKLQLGEVLKACKQVVAGTNHELLIRTKEPSSRTYSVVVFDPLPVSKCPRQLTKFVGLLG